MGYDFCVIREQVDMPAGYKPMFPDEPRSYQLNVFGMAAILQVMTLAGIIDSEASHAEWPRWPPEGMSEKRANALADHVFRQARLFPPATRREREIVTLLGAESDAIRTSRTPRSGLVPAFKFRSNAGWLVHPDECLLIANRLREALESSPLSILPDPERSGISYDEAKARVLDWVAYNEFAAINGGYQVW